MPHLAVDYITKPAEPKELVARVGAAARTKARQGKRTKKVTPDEPAGLPNRDAFEASPLPRHPPVGLHQNQLHRSSRSPAARQQPEGTQGLMITTATTVRRRVLVIDDEVDIRAIVSFNLVLAGMTVGEARDGKEALDRLRDGAWDACVLDLAMPRLDGFEVLRTLTGEGITDRMAVIVLSAKASPAAAMEAMELGAHAHLTKPFSPRAVAHTVNELIGLSPEERRERRSEMHDRADTLARLGLGMV